MTEEMEIVMTRNNGEYEWALVKLLHIEALYKSGLPLNQCCKAAGISVHTYYKWRKEEICFESPQKQHTGT
jgi:hypothetical protein